MIAVTTRSRARGLRKVAPMLLAMKPIERDLKTAPGCDRYVTVVSGPKEVWTLSIWRDPNEMRAFMRTRTHAHIMWNQPDWLESYWGMRWRVGVCQAGTWVSDSPPGDRAGHEQRSPRRPRYRRPHPVAGPVP